MFLTERENMFFDRGHVRIARHDECLDGFAQDVIFNADNTDLNQFLAPEQGVLDESATDALTTALNEISRPAGDVKKAFTVDGCEISGEQPLSAEALSSFLRLAPIATGDVIALRNNLADFPGIDRIALVI